MDGNKDEALKCLGIGKEALDGGDKARALKFVLKARRLYPSLPVDDFLARIAEDRVEREATPAAESNLGAGQSTVRQRVGVSELGGGGGAGASSSSKDYTEEQVLVVRQIRKKKDYYEILGVERSCSVEDVRKAYRKLSLKVHPDKNKAPGAEEAFKLVSKAFQCLSNEESKRKYDISGSDEPVYEGRPTGRAAHGFNRFYEGDLDAEEIFRNFFFGRMGVSQQTQFRGFQFGTGMGHRAPPANGSPGGSGFRTLIQLLPVILIVLLNFLPSNDPIYSLQQSYPYDHKFSTQKGVPFYVKSPNFEQQYPPSTRERLSLELKIERDFFNIVGQNCRVEMQRMHWGLANKAPHCDMLKQFEGAA